MIFQPDQVIGGYRIVRLLGQGGMGAVYEVEHVKLGVRYALKTFTFEGGHDGLLKNKFLAEGKVLARLRDPRLVRVFDLDFDETLGTLYFVMDLVLCSDGEPHTLADIKTDDLDEDCILAWFGELASALDYIHAQGIVHRDVKLGNVLLNAERHVILSDFGVSRFFSQNLRREISAVNTMVSDVTVTSRLAMGTRGYMAPEVVRGEEATPAADAYSLGVMFVYLLTGLWYESGSKVFRLLDTLEYRWNDVLKRLLADNPSDRPTNLAALVKDVRRNACASGMPSSHPSSGVMRKRRIAHVGVGVAVLVALAVGAILYFSRASTPSKAHAFDAVFSSRGIYEVPRK